MKEEDVKEILCYVYGKKNKDKVKSILRKYMDKQDGLTTYERVIQLKK